MLCSKLFGLVNFRSCQLNNINFPEKLRLLGGWRLGFLSQDKTILVEDLVVDGNHSIEAVEESKYGKSGSIPTIYLQEHSHNSLPDDDVDLLALRFNPRVENPRLQSSHEDIARQVCKWKVNGLDTNSKEVQDLYHDFHLSKSEKAKVSKIANQMYIDITPNNATWINYGAGKEKKDMQNIINREDASVFAKCYSTAKYNAWSDLYDIILHNKNNEHKIKTYKVKNM